MPDLQLQYISPPSSDTCVRCGYDLRGVANDQPCTECGLLAERSRRPTDRLRDGRPGYLRQLSAGIWMVILTFVGPLFWFVFLSLLPITMFLTSIDLFAYIPFSVFAMLCFSGVWLLTAEEKGDIGRHPRRRWVTRMLAAVPGVAMAMIIFCQYLHIRPDAGLNELLWLIGCSFLLVFPPILGLRLGELGKRLLSREITEDSLIVGFGISVTVLLWCGALLVTHYSEWLGLGSNWADRSKVWLFITATGGALIILFWFWTLLLLVRFALEFWREARAMRQAWALSDRSAKT